jgi:hypothetical protein
MIARFTTKLLAVSVFSAAAVVAPAVASTVLVPSAYADAIPEPGPEMPQPGESGAIGADDCGSGETRGADGVCVAAMGGVAAPEEAQPEPELAPRTTQDITTTSATGVGSNLIPNINGDSCTGYWQSVACYEMDQDNVAVQPRSTLSSSP